VGNDSQDRIGVREALCALLSDIEAMYEGAEILMSRGQPEEFFGPFAVSKLGSSDIDSYVSISWPNLAISMRNAKIALTHSG
jgi:hypothetical protein